MATGCQKRWEIDKKLKGDIHNRAFIIERTLFVKSYSKFTHVPAKIGGFVYEDLQWCLIYLYQIENSTMKLDGIDFTISYLGQIIHQRPVMGKEHDRVHLGISIPKYENFPILLSGFTTECHPVANSCRLFNAQKNHCSVIAKVS